MLVDAALVVGSAPLYLGDNYMRITLSSGCVEWIPLVFFNFHSCLQILPSV